MRRLFSIADVLGRIGIDLGRRRKVVCPLPMHIHAHNTPSFSVFQGLSGEDRFFCHGNCGASGDVIDLAGYLWVAGYDPTNGKKVYAAAEILTNKALSVPRFSMPERPKRFNRAAMDHYPLLESGRAYAHQRGLDDDTIFAFSLGQDKEYLCIPTLVDGQLVSIKKRCILPVSTRARFMSEPGSRVALFNHDAVAYQPGDIFYLKSEIPVMLMSQLGFLACSTNYGEGTFDPAWSTLLALADVMVVGDNDDTGRVMGELRAKQIPGTLRFPPAKYKDIDEWILAEPVTSVIEISQWISAA